MDFNLNRLRAFMTVARLGNLSAAAKELGITQPHLGRQMAALSKEVDMPLLVRHSRGVVLTEQGREYLELCEHIIGQLEQNTSLIRERSSGIQGTLKVMTGIGDSIKILNNLQPLLQKYPNLHLIISSISDIYQFKIGDVDVGIMPFISSDPDLLQYPLYDTLIKIYAAPSYLATHPLPSSLEDLQNHNIILYRGTTSEITKTLNIHLTGDESKDSLYKAVLEVNTGLALQAALVNGLGIGSFWYDADLLDKNLLVDVFPNILGRKIPYYFTYHRRLENSPKVHVFHEFLKELIKVWEPPEEKYPAHDLLSKNSG